ncbi:MAG: SDR family NAD(P)-dependent oxidoreductase [Pirellulales bacterium]
MTAFVHRHKFTGRYKNTLSPAPFPSCHALPLSTSERSPTMSQLKNKVAVVTGASKGIGAAIAKRLAAAGATVVVNYSSSKAEADKVVEEITKKGGKGVAVQANLAKPEEVAKLFAETKKQFDKVDILVNNAGIYAFAPLAEVTPDLFHKQFDLNVLGLLLATKEAVKLMGTNGGAVVNISSVAARSAPPTTSVYSATKGAVDSITRSLSQELGAKKIRVNSVNPGMIETEGVRAAGIHDSDFAAQVLAQTPLGRIGQPDDIASAVLFLVSDDSSWVTGETFYISGGLR